MPEYVVKPGDSLWAIACRDLGGDASDTAVSRRWREIYAENAQVVGANPNLIYPGQRLVLPRSDG